MKSVQLYSVLKGEIMLMITQYADEKLKEFSEKIEKNPIGWHVMWFLNLEKFAPTDYDQVRLQVVNATLSKHLDDENIHVFFCYNGDIVMLCQGAKKENIEAAQKELVVSFFDKKFNKPKTSIIFDMTFELENFLEMVREKFAEKTFSKEREVKINDISEYTKKIAENIDKDYAKDILEQRKVRQGLRILLVEDDKFTLKLMSNLFSEYTVIRAMDGPDAVETYMLNAPDVVFLDIGLVTMNGHEVLERILAFDPDAYVVMVTGRSFIEDISRAIANGAKGFVSKPFPKEKLVSYVKTYQKNKKSVYSDES